MSRKVAISLSNYNERRFGALQWFGISSALALLLAITCAAYSAQQGAVKRRLPAAPGVKHLARPPATAVLRATGVQNLVEVQPIQQSLLIELRYATNRNFTGHTLYFGALCILHKGTAEKLLAANSELQKQGYRLKIWDAYRPLSVQRALWKRYPKGGFVADPRVGSLHNRAAAVDVTLVDSHGKEVAMPSGFDDFSPRASIDYRGGSAAARKNRELLGTVMRRHGFRRIHKEWWHFNDSEAKKYRVLDISFKKLALRAVN